MKKQNRNDPNYLLQLNAFHRWLDTHLLPPNAKLLWFMLIDLCNSCDWAEWVQVDAQRMLRWIGAKNVKSVYRARDALVKAGLLDYERGTKGQPNRYRLLFFRLDNVKNGMRDGTRYGTQCGTQYGTQYGTQNVTKAGHINKQKQNINKTKQNTLPSAEADRGVSGKEAYEQITGSFNRICVSLPKVQAVNDRRRQAIRTCAPVVADFGGWDVLFRAVEQSDFLTGRSGDWNGCGFDWILKPANLVKILEGNYANKDSRKEGDPHVGSIDVGTTL